MRLKYILIILLLFCFTKTSKAQHFLNGSFEENTAQNCYYAVLNSSFSRFVNHVYGIGTLQQHLDILFDDSCSFYTYAKDGHYVVGLEINTGNPGLSSAISLGLSDTLHNGNAYFFSYFDKIHPLYTGDSIEIGIASDSNSFGSLIYTSPIPTSASWTKRIVTFIAPIDGKYITVRAKIGTSYCWVLIDNFSKDTTAVGLDNLPNELETLTVFPNPSNGMFNFHLSNNNEIIKTLEISNMLNQEIILSNNCQVDLSKFKQGVYYYKIVTTGGKMFFGKLIKQ